ncbi:MAG: hypothetical protein ACOXZY_04005 [Patescibacteria group bacterium]
MITSNDAEAMAKAIKIVDDITHEVEVDEIYEGEGSSFRRFWSFCKYFTG